MNLSKKEKMNKDFLELCELIIESSMYWTGEDEKKIPQLKRLRTLAGYYLNSDVYVGY